MPPSVFHHKLESKKFEAIDKTIRGACVKIPAMLY